MLLRLGSLVPLVLMLSVASTGSGLVLVPIIFADAGILLGAVLLPLFAALAVASHYFLALGVEFGCMWSFEELSCHLLGKRYERAVRWMLLIFNFGTAVCCIVLLSEVMASVHPRLKVSVPGWLVAGGGDEPGDASFPIRAIVYLTSTPTTMTIALWAVVLLPASCLLRRLDRLRYAAPAAVLATACVVVAITYRYYVPLSYTGDAHSPESNRTKDIHFNQTNPLHSAYSGKGDFSFITPTEVDAISLYHISDRLSVWLSGLARAIVNNTSTGGALPGYSLFFNIHLMLSLAFPILMYCFNGPCLVFQIYTEIKPSSRQNSKTVAVISLAAVALSFCLFALAGLFGALSFGGLTRGNIIQNFSPSEDRLMFAACLFFCVPICVAYNCAIFPCRDAFFNWAFDLNAADVNIGETDEQGEMLAMESPVSTKVFLLSSLAFSVLALLFAIMTPGIIIPAGLLGALFSTSLCLVYPAMVRMALARGGIAPYGIYSFADFQHLDQKHGRRVLRGCTPPEMPMSPVVPLSRHISPMRYGSIASRSSAGSRREFPVYDVVTDDDDDDFCRRLHRFRGRTGLPLESNPEHPNAALLEWGLANSMLLLGVVSTAFGTLAAIIKLIHGTS